MIKIANRYTTLAMWILITTFSIAMSGGGFLFENVYAQQSGNVKPNDGQLSKDVLTVRNLIIPDARGGFSSLQADSDHKLWITTGKWNLVSNPAKVGLANSSSVGFNASIDMKGADNLNEHGHKVSDFKFAKGSIRSTTQGSIFTFNGTATIATPQGIRPDVPISVKIIDKQPISLAVDDQTGRVMPQWVPGGGVIILSIDGSVQDHFGRTPVYGNVRGR